MPEMSDIEAYQLPPPDFRTDTTLAEADYPVASRIIRDTIAAELVKLEDPQSKSKKHARYVPFWA